MIVDELTFVFNLSDVAPLSTPSTTTLAPDASQTKRMGLFLNVDALMPGSVIWEIATSWHDEIRVLPKATVHTTSK